MSEVGGWMLEVSRLAAIVIFNYSTIHFYFSFTKHNQLITQSTNTYLYPVEIITATPLWFILFCLLAGAGGAWLLYRNDSRFEEVHKWLLRLMTAFRFVVIFILAFFLLSPMIHTASREVEKPIVIIAADNSSSLRYSDTLNYPLSELKNDAENLRNELSKKYDVRFISFGEKTNDNPDLNFNEKLSDFSNLFDDLKIKYSGRNLGAIVLATDGIFNSGSNPLYAARDFKIPVYTIAIGDTTVRKDILVSGVNHNKIAYLQNNFPLMVSMDARQSSGSKTTLTVQEDSSVLFTRNIDVAGNKYHLNIPIVLQAKSKGTHRYRISLSTIAGEVNNANNVKDVFVEVLENKQKILLLSNAPHPDLAAIKNCIETNQNYEAEIGFAKDFGKKIAVYNLVIMHQLPSSSSAVTEIINDIVQTQTPVFFILGGQTNVNAFNNLNTGISISQQIGKNNEVLPFASENFSLFTMNESSLKYINTLPPLIAPFGNYKPAGEIYSLLMQRIGQVVTQQPLLFFSNTNTKTAVLTGEGFWKWRLREFADKSNNEATDELLSKIIQYLVVKEKKSPLRVNYKTSFAENEPLLFDAELYNQSNELVNEPDVFITIASQDKKEYKFTFNKSGKAYSLNTGLFPPGTYSFKAESRLGSNYYTDGGAFTVNALQVENMDVTANHQLLFAMSEFTGGKMFYPDKFSEIAKAIETKEDIKPVSYYHNKLIDLISLKWIFGLLVLFLSLEWFLRKRSGAY